ncbi:hypothetical protein BOTBODRAFT_179360 [Botryobasidium botryosum FD-172 SS1]|uniref:SET domain-containing protein n=1 Tax=Botryobasidium botryosum (strain FD-172 SS1) TaxID=930990 RepID=A0A067M0F2_BOTB1|nr:hypothetical protein BOTBODRAFT_179360 [Botryobasidium botryosum FD-172 SS1]
MARDHGATLLLVDVGLPLDSAADDHVDVLPGPWLKPMPLRQIEEAKKAIDATHLLPLQPIERNPRETPMSTQNFLRSKFWESPHNGCGDYVYVGYDRHFSQAKLSDLKRTRALTKTNFCAEDPQGRVHQIHVHRFPGFDRATTAVVDTVFPLGTLLAIREPPVRQFLSGTGVIQVDSPSDIIFVRPWDAILRDITWNPLFPAPVHPHLPQTAAQWKAWGNVHFGDGQYYAAAVAYSKGLELDSTAYILLLNRAAAYIHLGYFEAALTDTANVMTVAHISEDERIKAIYRGAQAQYGVCRYKLALEQFARCLAVAPQLEPNLQGWVMRCHDRIRESEKGEYDWVGMFNDALIPGQKVEAADFVGPIKITQSSRGGGRGIVATRSISVGELLVVSQPLVSAFPHEFAGLDYELGANFITMQADGQCRQALISRLIAKITGNPKLYPIVTALYAGPTFPAPPPQLPSPSPDIPPLSNPLQFEVDMDVNLLEHICTYNAFYLKDVTKTTSYCAKTRDFFYLPSALYLLPSLFNHACSANATWHHFGDIMVIRAARNLTEGEEITLSYISGPGDTFLSRQAELALHTTSCDCEECQADRADGEEIYVRRASLDIQLRSDEYYNNTHTVCRNARLLNDPGYYSPTRGPIRPTLSRACAQSTEALARDAMSGLAVWSDVVAEGLKSLEAAGIVLFDKATNPTFIAPRFDDSPVIGTERAPTHAAEMCVGVMLRIVCAFYNQGDMRMAKRWLDAACWREYLASPLPCFELAFDLGRFTVEGVHVGVGPELFILRYGGTLESLDLMAFVHAVQCLPGS